MSNADKWVHPTKFTGEWPDGFAGWTWLDWDAKANAYHPGDDYNFGGGDEDCGQEVASASAGIVWHTSEKSTGYGKLIIIKHTIGYNLKRLIKDIYGIQTDTLYTLYAHMREIMVSKGNQVDAGALIGKVGKTGTKHCHLHFEIYSLHGELNHTHERFYPVGWDKERIAENWLPAYSFIEVTKNMASYEQFLGKSKDYWLQVEKDRKDLLKQLGDKDKEFLKIKTGLDESIEKLTKENQQLKKESAKWDENLEKIDKTHQSALQKKDEKIQQLNDNLRKVKNRLTDVLEEQSEKLKIADAFILFINTLKNIWKKGGQNEAVDKNR